MYKDTPAEQNVTVSPNNHVSWKAIFGGIVIALSITVVFNLIGLGLGFTAFSVDSNTLSTIKISSVVWLLLCSILSMFAGGWVAGRLSSFTYYEPETILSGLIIWGIVTLVTFSLMASSMGALLSGGLSLIERAATVTTQAAGSGLNAAGRIASSALEVAPDMEKLISRISEQAEPLLDNLKSQTASEEPNNNKTISKETAKKRLEGVISSLLSANSEDEKNYAKNEATKFLTQNLDMNEQVAQETIANWQSNYDEAKEQMTRKAEEAKNKAASAAESASHTTGKIALIAAIINLFGALAAVIGSIIGYRSLSKKDLKES